MPDFLGQGYVIGKHDAQIWVLSLRLKLFRPSAPIGFQQERGLFGPACETNPLYGKRLFRPGVIILEVFPSRAGLMPRPTLLFLGVQFVFFVVPLAYVFPC
jgi:hypothetical protein